MLSISYQAVSSRKMPSRSRCMNNSPPLKYSNIKYSFPPVWNAYIKSTMKGCWKQELHFIIRIMKQCTDNTIKRIRHQQLTLTASRIFLSALVWAVSFWFLTIEAFRRTFIANMVPASWPESFLTWNTLPYPPFPKTFNNSKSAGPVFSLPMLCSDKWTVSKSSELKNVKSQG